MAIVNPSINISIGDYGEKYITSFHNYFSDNEPFFKDYSAFYKCKFTDGGICFNPLNGSNKTCEFDLNENDRAELLSKLKEDDCQFFIKNSISNAYTNLVNLVNQLETNINFEIVNVNIILSSFEDNVTILLNQIINQINKLSNSGAISHISIKVFSVISKSKDLLNADEQIITYQNLEEIKNIKSKFSSDFHNVVFIDNLNTKTIYLKINEVSIGFVLNEFITYLMTNHYKMIGNLFGSDFISLGIGTLLFDNKYFTNFFNSKIMKKLVKEQQINENKNWIKTTEYNTLRNDVLYPFLRGDNDFTKAIAGIKKELNVNKKTFTLLEYKFLIANLLGKHNDVELEKPYSNTEKISLYDLVFNVLNKFNSVSNDTNIDILEYKNRLDEVDEKNKKISRFKEFDKNSPCAKIKRIEDEIKKLELKVEDLNIEELEEHKGELNTEILELNKKIEEILKNSNHKDKNDACDNNQLKKLEEEVSKLEKINNEEKQIIEKTIYQFKENKIKPEIENYIKPGISKNIDALQVKRKEIEDKRKSFFTRLFKPHLKKELISIDSDININRNKKDDIVNTFKEVTNSSVPFFEFIEELEIFYNLLLLSIENIKELNTELSTKYKDLELLDYLFVKNIIKKNKLETFYNNKEKDFQTNFSNILNKIKEISLKEISENKKDNEFISHLNSTLSNTINSIIDFNIVDYMNGEYDNMELFKKEKAADIISDLLKISKPFFNADVSFDPKNAHRLMLHNNEKSIANDKLHKQLKSSFPAAIPLQIDTENNNKFSLVQIDIIKDLNHIVKYSESFKIYVSKKANTIIIN